MRLLLVTPPMTQLNTPYPATAYLLGFLSLHADELGLELAQADPSLELFLRLFSRQGMTRVCEELSAMAIEHGDAEMPPSVRHLLENRAVTIAIIDSVVHFLQGRDPSLGQRIASRDFLPEGPRFESIHSADDEQADSLEWAFGELGTADRAKYLASLFIDDLGDAIRDGIDDRFELSRYAERLAASAPSFDDLEDALLGDPSLVDDMLDEISHELVAAHRPDVLAVSIPFPGNVYGAFRIAKVVKELSPETTVVFGGGYVNTELRELSDPRIFEWVDFVTLDDGEKPLLSLLERLRGEPTTLLRTFHRRDGEVIFETDPTQADIAFADVGTPTYRGLDLHRYVSLFEMLNPMHRLWSDNRWNKLTLAHGCYWKKCTFCDVTLDYIKRYDAAPADILVDRIEALIEETGQTGFHFVDEAAPPALLRAVANKLIERNVVISWWGNVRFEKTFTPELAELLAESGCIAISGGLEVASDRLLELMKKGITVEQVARVTRAFTSAHIMVHAYLMYGFPTQTEQETIDSLERVRQLFAAGCIQSAFWHRFAATAHSPIGLEPDVYGIKLRREPSVTFARNDVAFDDPTGTDHDGLGACLRRAVYNFMHDIGLDEEVGMWFEDGGVESAVSSVSPTLVADALA